MEGSPQPVDDHHHRNVQGGAARAAVFGVSDGLVSNVALVLGMAGATTGPSLVRIAGMLGLLGGALSMAAGEYNSMRAQAELLERELEIERREIARRPEGERKELAALYRARGLAPQQADDLATAMMRDPETALETHAREELGIDPSELGSPTGAAVSSFGAFSVGALIPILPWFVLDGGSAVAASLVLAAIAAVVVGAVVGHLSGRSWGRPVARQLVLTAVPAALSYALGSVVGGTSAV